MKTSELLKSLPQTNFEWLTNSKAQLNRGKALDNKSFIEEKKNLTKGYIRGMIDCGVIKQADFKTLWCWFTL